LDLDNRNPTTDVGWEGKD
jgi:hypothetical protein